MESQNSLRKYNCTDGIKVGKYSQRNSGWGIDDSGCAKSEDNFVEVITLLMHEPKTLTKFWTKKMSHRFTEICFKKE